MNDHSVITVNVAPNNVSKSSLEFCEPVSLQFIVLKTDTVLHILWTSKSSTYSFKKIYSFWRSNIQW